MWQAFNQPPGATVLLVEPRSYCTIVALALGLDIAHNWLARIVVTHHGDFERLMPSWVPDALTGMGRVG